MRAGRREEFRDPRRFALLPSALHFGVNARRRQLALRGENRTAEIEAAYCQEEAKEESRLEAKRRKIEKGRVE